LIKFLDSFLEAMNACEFSGIVFDYDGTLCDPTDRFKQPKPDVALSLDNLLSHGIPMGIATGRGRSVQKALREVVKKKYWERVLVGNYNCSVTAPLTKEPPPQENNPNGLIQVASNLLHRDFGAINKCQVEVRARQISLIMTEPTWKRAIFQGLLETLANLSGLKIVQSGHSIDILHPDVSKTRIVDELKATMLAGERNILVIGDQGQYGGNDFELLSLPHSLSVNKVSASLTSCWNLSPVGSRGAEAVVSMMRAMRAAKGFFKVNVEELERETCK
jgi:hydroxymethylpyrimidine pyrophosphatase-like HAD family hydrolase